MGPIQSSINTALGVAALASGLTNKKQVDRAQDKLDKSEENLAKTTAEKVNTEENLANKEVQLAKTTEAKNKAEQEIKDINDEEIKQNMLTGGNTFNVSNDLPTAKETNINNAGDKIDVISNNSVNNSIGSSMNDYLKSQPKADPYAVEQIMSFHALKMLDSRVAAKRAVEERIKSRRTMISDRTRAARAKMGGNE